MKNRMLVPELMDDPGLNPDEHRRALAGLRRINFFSRTSSHLVSEINQIVKQKNLKSISILDVGCGSGDVAIGVATQISLRTTLQLEGWDISPTSVTCAQQNWERNIERRTRVHRPHYTSVLFRQIDVFEPPDSQFDIVYCCLFLHHFSLSDAVRIVASMLKLARHAVFIDDLRRTRFGLLLAKFGCYALSRSPVVHFDGPQSVRAAFSDIEALDIANRAGVKKIILRRHWPERFCLRLEKDQ